jgi:hypothetical protein
MTAKEQEVLYLGWPESGGVWILRLPNRNHIWYGFGRAKNRIRWGRGAWLQRWLGQRSLRVRRIVFM